MTQVSSNVVITKIERKENSFRMEVKGKVVKEGGSVLSLLNEGDSRFDVSDRYAWMKVEPEAIEKYFGVSAEKIRALEKGQSLELNIHNPQLGGLPLSIQIVERQLPENDYEIQNWDKAAKQVEVTQNVLKSVRLKKSAGVYDTLGQQAYFMKDGKLVFSTASVVTGDPQHVFVNDAQLITLEEARAIVSSGLQIVEQVPAATTTPVNKGAEAEI